MIVSIVTCLEVRFFQTHMLGFESVLIHSTPQRMESTLLVPASLVIVKTSRITPRIGTVMTPGGHLSVEVIVRVSKKLVEVSFGYTLNRTVKSMHSPGFRVYGKVGETMLKRFGNLLVALLMVTFLGFCNESV